MKHEDIPVERPFKAFEIVGETVIEVEVLEYTCVADSPVKTFLYRCPVLNREARCTISMLFKSRLEAEPELVADIRASIASNGRLSAETVVENNRLHEVLVKGFR